MNDQGYNSHNDKIMQSFQKWSQNIAETQLTKELQYVPDTVALLGCLEYAARKVAIRKDLLTKDMAIQLFSNMLDEMVCSCQLKS